NNNSARDTDTLTPKADLAITKTDGVTSAVPGSSPTYTIAVSNNGPSAVTGAGVSDALPAGVTGGIWAFTGQTGGGSVTGPNGGRGAGGPPPDHPTPPRPPLTLTLARRPPPHGPPSTTPPPPTPAAPT